MPLPWVSLSPAWQEDEFLEQGTFWVVRGEKRDCETSDTFIKRLSSSSSLSAIRVVSSEVIDISPGHLDSSLYFIQPSISHY